MIGFAFVLIFLNGCFGGTTDLPIVTTTLGQIGGTIQKSLEGRTFFAFEGIPYGRPPIGKHRFKESLPAKPWVGTWKADTTYACLQYAHFTKGTEKVHGSEDCLYLNVFTPTLNLTSNFDVIVYIHGGAFMFGVGGNYQPHFLMDNDVVYVSISYRLGPLGFLSTEDDVVPGNNGIKDQILALKWVKENINYFGGNPDSITLYGMSAGGASVHLHTLTPKSKGLFARGFSQSGTMLCPWVLMENPLETTQRLAASLGCGSDSTKVIVDCLRKRPAKQIVGAVKQFQPWLYNPFSPFGVVVDGQWASDPVLFQHPYQLLKNNKVSSDVPWLTSRVSGEGLYPGVDFYDDNLLDELDAKWDDLIPHVLHYNFTTLPKNIKGINKKIRDFYFGNEKISKNNYHTLIQLIGDRLFDVDIEKATRLQAKAIQFPVFHYYFDYRGMQSWTSERKTNNSIGVSHADDTAYVLKTSVDVQSTETDREISKIMVDLVVSFAQTGKPSKSLPEWPQISKKRDENIQYLTIKSPSDIFVETKAYLGNRKFWDSLGLLENENLFEIKTEL